MLTFDCTKGLAALGAGSGWQQTQNDDKLVEKARAGDRDAFGELIRKHHGTCVTIATRILRDRSEAEDEVQKAYWQAFSHLDQFQAGRAQHAQSFLAWLLRIVKNQCLMLIRVKRRMPLVYIDAAGCGQGRPSRELPANNIGAEQGILEREMVEVLQKEIQRIPPLLRSVLLLCDMEERSMMDVAQQLQITIPAAKSRLFRARRELKKRVIVHWDTRERSTSSRKSHQQSQVAV